MFVNNMFVLSFCFFLVFFLSFLHKGLIGGGDEGVEVTVDICPILLRENQFD